MKEGYRLLCFGRLSGQRVPLLAFLLAVVLSSSAEQLTAQIGWSVRDSAGVRLVESEAQLWNADQAWELSEEPVLRIGELEGDEDYLLYGAAWSAFLSDGRIVVLNAGSHEVRIFSQRGVHERSFGRTGDGPGEFRAPRTGVVLPGDTIVVQDNQDLKFFTDEGRFVRQVRIAGGRPFPWPNLIGRAGTRLIFLDGDWESRRFHYDEQGRPTGRPEVREGVDRGRYAVVEYDRDGVLIDTLSQSVGRGETWISRTGNGQSYTSIPFSRGQYWSTNGEQIVTGHSAVPEIRFLDATGAVNQISRIPLPEVDAGPEAFWDHFDRTYGDEPIEVQRRVRERYEQMPKYRYLPLLGGLNVVERGRVWVRSYSPAHADDDPRWFVVSATGAFLGVVRPRPRIWIDGITDQFVLGRGRDELGVEYVVVYRIVKSG